MTIPEPHAPLPEDSRTGRHAVPREVLVADIGGSYIRLGRHRQGTDCELLANVPTPADDWEQFCAAVYRVVRPVATRPSALSISIAGVVSPDTGHVTAANLPCLTGQPLAIELQARLDMPVLVTNDADCAALAEARVGAGVGHAVVFCAVLGTGVGGGLAVNGQLVRGEQGLTGEWGHAPIVNEALLEIGGGLGIRVPRLRCGCGQTGCLDTVGGARGMERLHVLLHRAEQSSRQILAGWSANEPRACATVRAYIELVSGPLALVVNVTGASAVPVCGGLGRHHELVKALDEAVRRQILRRSEHALVVPSTLGEQAGLLGASYAFDEGAR